MKKQALKAAPAAATIEVNAKFKSRLPEIIEEICRGLLVIEPAVQDITVPLKEFQDYLGFEIAKIRLELAKAEWESVVDKNKVLADKAWLLCLEQLQQDFDVQKMTSSVTFIRSMVKRLQDTFDVRPAL